MATGHAQYAEDVRLVPALESVALSDARLIAWNVRDGEPPAQVARETYFDQPPGRGPGLAHGVVMTDGVPTKHYLKEELEFLLAERGFTITQMEKLEFPWATEFYNPSRWLRAPYPLDWFVVARKGRAASSCNEALLVRVQANVASTLRAQALTSALSPAGRGPGEGIAYFVAAAKREATASQFTTFHQAAM